MKAYIIAITIFVIGLFLLIGGCSMFYTIQPGERGIAVTLGKMDDRAIGEGFGFALPWTTIYHVSIKSGMQSDSTECFTADTQVVKISYNVLMSIPENRVCSMFREYNTGDSVFKTLVSPRMQEALKQITSQYRADQIVKKRDEVRAAAMSSLKKAVGDILNISDVNITNIDFTDALEKAIEQKTVKEQEALAAKYAVEKAQQEAEATIAKAKGEAEALRIQSEALKQSQSMILLEAIRKWNGQAPQTLLLGNNPSAMIPIK